MLSEQEILNIRAGAFGVDIIADTAAHEGPFGLLIPLEDTVVAGASSPFLKGSLAGKTLPKGVPVGLIQLETITLTSGSLLAYRAPIKRF